MSGKGKIKFAGTVRGLLAIPRRRQTSNGSVRVVENPAASLTDLTSRDDLDGSQDLPRPDVSLDKVYGRHIYDYNKLTTNA